MAPAHDFIYLETHSRYSLGEGTLSLPELVSFAEQFNDGYLAVCDTNNFYGLVNLLAAGREKGLKTIIGARLTHGEQSALLLAQNRSGYSALSRLITRLKLEDDAALFMLLRETPSRDFFVITDDPALLAEKRPHFCAEINPLKQDYYQTYLLAKRLNILPVFNYPVYFGDGQYPLHQILSAIRLNKRLTGLRKGDLRDRRSFPQPKERLHAQFAHVGEALQNTYALAERCLFPFQTLAPIMPRFAPAAFDRLRALCYRNIEKRYGAADRTIVDRLEKELAVIREKNFSDLFLVVHDFVRRFEYTCGRGSAAASLVSYLLFITHVDPIKHRLFFERFMNVYRSDPPDIDIDFPWDERDDVLAYIFQKYGPERTAMIANHVTYSTRSSYRETARVFGVPEDRIKRYAQSLSFFYNREFDQYEAKPAEDSSVRKDEQALRAYAVRLAGFPHHLSVHCGGVVITPEPLSDYIPCERAAKGVRVIQLEKDQAEDFGFVKIDVLGNRSLAVVRDTLRAIEKYGKKLPYAELNPLEDAKVIANFAAGRTIGVFYVESPAMRQLQKKTGRGDYEHLVIHSSIIRPAANAYINEYVRRLKGAPYAPLLPALGDVLKETYGIMCYQEDITRVAMAVADFPLDEAHELRKIVSKKNKELRKRELREKLFRNMRARGAPEAAIEGVWDMIESFRGYSFCKPHSASYALLSFKACYLKTYYPAEFMAAVLKNQGGFYTPLGYISEARRLGLAVIKPDVNRSRYHYYGEKETVYVGFQQLKGLTTRFALTIEEERERSGPYRGLLDFIKRTGATPADTTLLIKTEAFRSVEAYTTPQLFYLMNRFYRNNRAAPGGKGLFDEIEETHPAPPDFPELSRELRLANERDVFGFLVSDHPLRYYRKYLARPAVRAKHLSHFTGKTIKVAGILVTAKTVLTKNHELMQFVSFEDEEVIFETVIFPQVYRRYAHRLHCHRPYLLTGMVTAEFGVVSLEVRVIEEVKNRAPREGVRPRPVPVREAGPSSGGRFAPPAPGSGY